MPSKRYGLRSNPPKDNTIQLFNFLSLPPELRIHIYRLLLIRSTPVALDFVKSTGNDVIVQTRGTTTTAHRETPLPSPLADPIHTAILTVNKFVYNEARPVLYSENIFEVHARSAIRSLNSLHQRSRSLIRHVNYAIPCHYDILDEFPDIVRLGLRYCWGLRTLVITLPFTMPDDGPNGKTCKRSVFANAFHIIRWLPKQTTVQLNGIVPAGIAAVVERHMVENSVNDEVCTARS